MKKIMKILTIMKNKKMPKKKKSKKRIPKVPMCVQREFVAIANAAESSKAELKKSITSIDAVMEGLING